MDLLVEMDLASEPGEHMDEAESGTPSTFPSLSGTNTVPASGSWKLLETGPLRV
jgi:hypothetical protein